MNENESTRSSIYSTLSKIDVSNLVDKKMGLNYLSWSKAWGLVKSIYPTAQIEITEYPEYVLSKDGWMATGRDVDYRLTSAGCEVEATVIIDEQKFSSKLYVMDNKMRPVMNPNYAQINKAQMRALVKALAFAGLGLSVYAGEDLPSEEDETPKKQTVSSLRKQAESIEVDVLGMKEPLINLYEDAKKGGKNSINSETLHSVMKSDARIAQLVKSMVKAGV